MDAMDRPRPLFAALATGLTLVVVLGATSCAEDGDDSRETTATEAAASAPTSADSPGAATTASAANTTAAETTAVETTAPASTDAPTTEVAPTTEAAPTTAVATSAPPTTAAPVTLGLQRDGLVVAALGTETEAAIAAVTGALGVPTEDTGWVDPLTISTCAGTELRRVSWGVLSLLFGDPAGAGARVFFAYSYGDVAGLGGQPAGLLTPEGLGLGTLVTDLRVAYPAVTVNAGEEGLVLSSFFVDEALAGLLTGATDADSVTVIFGGPFCG